MQGADHGDPEHPRDQLADAAREMRQLPGAHQRALSAGRARHRNTLGLHCVALRIRRRHRCGAGVHVVPDRAHDDRLRHAIPSGCADLPAAVARAHREPVAPGLGRRRNTRGTARQHHRRCRRLSQLVGCVLGLQMAHRQGRHGLRRLQAVRRARRLAGLADAAAHHRAGLGRRRHLRHRGHDSPAQGPRYRDGLRPIPRNRRLGRSGGRQRPRQPLLFLLPTD